MSGNNSADSVRPHIEARGVMPDKAYGALCIFNLRRIAESRCRAMRDGEHSVARGVQPRAIQLGLSALFERLSIVLLRRAPAAAGNKDYAVILPQAAALGLPSHHRHECHGNYGPLSYATVRQLIDDHQTLRETGRRRPVPAFCRRA